ncbi:MAG: outer membrane protein assembly factor BamA [Opitutales bacterium]|nr:outer membrane protein assembly factor BamA [Opitutales bacterium]MBT5167259.1 outer membrane protein assembly factor BamA [Opitutales bacterium]MBT5816015.1 outer membrane protein assembly factor BamA [Opitutales bacterium]
MFSVGLAQDVGSSPEEPQPPKIRRLIVNFTGLSNVNEEVARANMSLREGEDYDQIAIDRDIRTLYRTQLFEHIEVRLQPVGEKEVDLLFDIRPKFRVASISFDGNQKLRDNRLEKELEVSVNHVLNERRVKDGAKALKDYYLKRGFSQARVEYEIDRNPATGFGNVVYKIREGGKYKITKVKFEGNENISSRKLRRKIKTKKRGIFSLFTGSGKFDADKFEDDLETLKDVYMEEGHLDIGIDQSQVKFSYPSKRRMVIEVAVDEGKEYRVGSIDFEGSELYKGDILRMMLAVKSGDIYRPERIDEDVDRLEDFYGQFGYMETRVRLSRIPNVTTGNMDIVYQIYESEKYQVESIEIEGNTKTKSTVVIRELAMGPGSTFDSVRMDASKMRLENTRYFEDVNLTPQTTQIPGRRDLRITFQEGRTGNFSFGAGFSSLEKGTFFIELTQSNFDLLNWRGAFQGDGQKFRLRAQIGSLSSQIMLAFEEPWLFEKRLALGFNIFKTESSLSDLYSVGQDGFDVSLRKRLFELIEGRVSYSLVQYGYSDFGPQIDETQRALFEESNGDISSVNLLLLRDTRDRIINTWSGSRFELDLTTAGGPLGGNFQYNKIESRNAIYLPLTRWHTQTIEVLLRAGVVKEAGDSTFVPYEERFYLGGPNTLRGFEFRDVSPKEGFYAPAVGQGRVPYEIGGKTYGLFSAEYSIGFTEGFRGAIFYDGGFVNKAAGDFSLKREIQRDAFDGQQVVLGWNQSGWNDNFGFGIRISVMGTPLRLDYAIPMSTSGSTDSGGNDNGAQFNFTFGGRL